MTRSEHEVAYEVSIAYSDAALVRFTRALVDLRGRFTDSFVLGSDRLRPQDRTVAFLVVLDHRTEDEFRQRVRPQEMRYRSPTRFDHGSLIPLFSTPAEEVQARALKPALPTAGQIRDALARRCAAHGHYGCASCALMIGDDQ